MVFKCVLTLHSHAAPLTKADVITSSKSVKVNAFLMTLSEDLYFIFVVT